MVFYVDLLFVIKSNENTRCFGKPTVEKIMHFQINHCMMYYVKYCMRIKHVVMYKVSHNNSIWNINNRGQVCKLYFFCISIWYLLRFPICDCNVYYRHVEYDSKRMGLPRHPHTSKQGSCIKDMEGKHQVFVSKEGMDYWEEEREW